jgi:hypothetical protein
MVADPTAGPRMVPSHPAASSAPLRPTCANGHPRGR